MSYRLLPRESRPCIWMTAGLVAYKLCDRDFDCERCPLDAALRGEAGEVAGGAALSGPGRRVAIFPEDRLYTPGHLWVQPVGAAGEHEAAPREAGERLFRIGLDAFAAALLGRCRRLIWVCPEGTVERGAALCELDVGAGLLSLGAPVRGRIGQRNQALEEDPELAVTSPYGEGWLVELAAGDSAGPVGLLAAADARERARLDLRLFRRRVALRLLDHTATVGATLQDGGAPLSDLRRILGNRGWLEVLRELIH